MNKNHSHDRPPPLLPPKRGRHLLKQAPSLDVVRVLGFGWLLQGLGFRLQGGGKQAKLRREIPLVGELLSEEDLADAAMAVDLDTARRATASRHCERGMTADEDLS